MEETYEDTNQVGLLGLNKKPKKKAAGTPGLLQAQLATAQEKPMGTLATMANEKGAMGTVDQGAMAEAELMKKKKKLFGAA